MDMPRKDKGEYGLLIGARSDNKIYLKIDGIPANGNFGYKIYPNPSSPSNAIPLQGGITNANPSFSYQLPIQSSPVDLIIELRENQNGTFIDHAKWKARAFPTGYRSYARNMLITNSVASTMVGTPLAKFLLREFIGATPNDYNENYMVFNNHIINVREERLTHNCGAIFDSASGNATVPIYSFSKDSNACFKIAHPQFTDSWNFASRAKEIAVSQESTIKDGMSTVPIGSKKSFDFSQIASGERGISFKFQNSPDLFAAIHSASLNISKLVYVYEKESPTKAVATEVTVKAMIEDLYDFDYYSNYYGALLGAHHAAALQIGQGRGVDSYGRIFVTRFHVDATFKKLTRTDALPPYGVIVELPSGYSHTITW